MMNRCPLWMGSKDPPKKPIREGVEPFKFDIKKTTGLDLQTSQTR